MNYSFIFISNYTLTKTKSSFGTRLIKLKPYRTEWLDIFFSNKKKFKTKINSLHWILINFQFVVAKLKVTYQHTLTLQTHKITGTSITWVPLILKNSKKTIEKKNSFRFPNCWCLLWCKLQKRQMQKKLKLQWV